ncbi:methyl-accepting chemotaxis protein, partial [Salmonella enterica subsp. enterica serovar Typhimurium]
MQEKLEDTVKANTEVDGGESRRLYVPDSDELSVLNRDYQQASENIQHIVKESKTGAVVLRNASSDLAAGNQD